MPSLDLTTDEMALIALTMALVMLPSGLSRLGNLLGRTFSQRRPGGGVTPPGA